jgi:carboxyl-terminal processing protease
MKIKRIFFGLSILSLLACNFVTQRVFPPTATPTPAATVTLTASSTPTATQTPLVPAFIPPECTNQPLATIAPNVLAQATPEVQVAPIPQGEQLGILRQIGDIVEHSYVYPDYNGHNWNEIESRYRRQIEAGLDTPSFYNEMSAMITELGDEHSFFLSPLEVAEADAELKGTGKYVGVGTVVEPDFARQRLIVISTYPGSAAEYAGIQAHDTILYIDNQPIKKEPGDLVQGPKCSAVKLTVQSPGEPARDVMLVRAAIQGNVPIDARTVTTSDGSKIGYIFIPSFYDQSLPDQIRDALNGFGKLDGLILDLRMNTGGISSVTYPIMQYFVQGRLGQFVSREDAQALDLEANEIQNSQTVPLVVMVGKGTVSFGEIFAGIMQDSGRAKIVGETSLGNVEVLNGYRFEDGSYMWLASETFHSAFSNANWEETGIVPDVQVSAPWDTFYFENDPSIAAAVNLMGHQ